VLRSVNARHSLLPQTTLKDSTSAATRMNHAHLIVMGINEFKNHSPFTAKKTKEKKFWNVFSRGALSALSAKSKYRYRL
jgi:hypothetical protein